MKECGENYLEPFLAGRDAPVPDELPDEADGV